MFQVHYFQDYCCLCWLEKEEKETVVHHSTVGEVVVVSEKVVEAKPDLVVLVEAYLEMVLLMEPEGALQAL